MGKWQEAQRRELVWWRWFFSEHIPLADRPRMEGYRLCEGRQMMLHCGIPQGGLTPQEITGKLLDVGCGAISVWEHRPDVEAVAIDPLLRKMYEDVKLSQFVELGVKHNALYLSQSLETAGFGSEFDWVWDYNVLDHTADWKEHLAHCKRVLRPGGVLLLGTDVRTAEYVWEDDERELHPSVFTSEEALQELDNLGMVVEWKRPLLKRHKFRFGLRARKE